MRPNSQGQGVREVAQQGQLGSYPATVSPNGRGAGHTHGNDPRATARRRKLLAVAMVVVPAIVVALILAGKQGSGTSALAATHDLQPGSVIGVGDLMTVQVSVVGGHVATVPANDRASLIGKTVAGPVSAGQLLTPSSIASVPELGANEVGMALALSPDQAAEGILEVGQSVLIVSGQAQAGQGLSVPARVVGLLPPASSTSQVVVDLAIEAPNQAGQVAAAAASTAGVRLVVLPGGPHA